MPAHAYMHFLPVYAHVHEALDNQCHKKAVIRDCGYALFNNRLNEGIAHVWVACHH